MTTESAFLNNPPAIFPADIKDSAMTTHLNFDPAHNQIVDPIPGDIYVRPDAFGVEYGVLAKIDTNGGLGEHKYTLALAGLNGGAKSCFVTAACPSGWKRADVDTTLGSLGEFVHGFVPRATEIERLREENFQRYVRAEEELVRFKDKVKRVAFEYGERFNLCEELGNALLDIGIDPTVTVTVTGSFSMTVTVPWGEQDDINPADYTDDIYFDVENTEVSND